MTSKTETLMQEVRKTAVFQQLIPMEAGIGFPIPLRKAGGVYLTLPLFGITVRRKTRETILYPPFATLTLNWETQTPVEYVNLRFRNPQPELNWQDPVGNFPHPAIAHLSIKQYREKRQELLAMYDELFDLLKQNTPFPTEWSQQFGALLHLMLEAPLEPYYRALAPKFFERFLLLNQAS